jgi:hypothetical protein
MVANAGPTHTPISRGGTSRSRAECKRFSRGERAIGRRMVRRAIDLSARRRRSKAVRTFTMTFWRAPLASMSPKASSVGTKRTDVVDGHLVAKIACQPLDHGRGRCHERSASRTDTLKPAMRGRVDADRSMIRANSASGIAGGGVCPLVLSQSRKSRDTPARRPTREGIIQMSPGRATISVVRHFIAPPARS